MEMKNNQTQQFEVVKKGGYNPRQVNHYIDNLQTQVVELKKQLAESLTANATASNSEPAAAQSPESRLYDPEWAAVKVLAAAQEAADKIIRDSQQEAKERVDAYHRENKAEIEAQNAIYESQKEELTVKLTEISKLRSELENEVAELQEQSRLKMSVMTHTMNEMNDVINNAGAVTAPSTVSAPFSMQNSAASTASAMPAEPEYKELVDSSPSFDKSAKTDFSNYREAQAVPDSASGGGIQNADENSKKPDADPSPFGNGSIQNTGQNLKGLHKENNAASADTFGGADIAENAANSASTQILDPLVGTGAKAAEMDSERTKRRSFFNIRDRAAASKDEDLTPEEKQWAQDILNSASEDFTHFTNS